MTTWFNWAENFRFFSISRLYYILLWDNAPAHRTMKYLATICVRPGQSEDQIAWDVQNEAIQLAIQPTIIPHFRRYWTWIGSITNAMTQQRPRWCKSVVDIIVAFRPKWCKTTSKNARWWTRPKWLKCTPRLRKRLQRRETTLPRTFAWSYAMKFWYSTAHDCVNVRSDVKILHLLTVRSCADVRDDVTDLSRAGMHECPKWNKAKP